MSDRAKTSSAGKDVSPGMPQSKPMQIFLLVALLISGASYAVDEWNRVLGPRHAQAAPDRLHRLVQNRDEYAAHMEAGLRNLRLNQFDQAMTQFRLASDAENSAEVHYNIALVLLKLNRPDDAVAQFKEAARLNPNYTDVYLAWGQTLMAQGRPEEAATEFHEALRVSPNSGEAQYDVALALIAQKKIAQADEQSAQDQEHAADAVTLAAKVERLRADALQRLAQARKFGVDKPELLLDYGQLLNESQKFADAEIYLRLAVSNKPNLADAHFQLADAQQHLGKETDAIAQYQATLALRPDDAPTLARLALIYAKTTNGDLHSPKMAIQLATRANDATTAQNPRYLDTLARCYAADDDFFQAINWENQAVHRAEQIHDSPLLQELRPRYDLFVQHKTD